MKRLIITALLLLSATVWAQDVVRDSTAALGDTVRKATRTEANILGAPVYYDINGNVRGSDNPSPVYHRPKHHYLNNLDSRYSSFFAEGEWMNGSTDMAMGINFTYLPKRWGAYASVLLGVKHDYLSVGPALRLSGYESTLDWHLYGGIMLGGRSAGAEIGLRIAAQQRNSEFCWTSASIGTGIVGGSPFITFGASFDIIALVGLTTILFW